MTPQQLPAEGAVLVVTEQPGEWGAAIADRNAKGARTALLVVPDDLDPADLAKQMAEEVFRGQPWHLVDARSKDSGPTPGMRSDT